MPEFEELTVETDFRSEDREVLNQMLIRHHGSQGKVRNPQRFCIFLRDRNAQIHGGLAAATYWERMYIESLWVKDSLRGQGWGRKLIEVAEAEARRRGCCGAHTDTYSWQSPEFYQSLGYSEYAILENYPPGHSLHYFKKEFV